MRRLPLCLALAALAAPAPAAAAVRLGDARLAAFAAGGGTAVAALATGPAAHPFTLVRAHGARATRVGAFGDRKTEDPAVAVDAAGRAIAAWERPVSGGLAYFAQTVGAGLGAPRRLAVGTGPGPVALDAGGSVLVAFPDTTGDVTVATVPGVTRPARTGYALGRQQALSADAPLRRHLALAVVATPDGPLVLDLVQQPGRSELRVEGPGAPAAPVVRVRGLHQIPAALAADGTTIAVAYLSGGRARLATAAGSAWRTRAVASRVASAPAVALVGGVPAVVYAQRPAGGGARDLWVARGGARRRLTRTAGDETAPLAGPGWVGWTRRDGRRTSALATPLR